MRNLLLTIRFDGTAYHGFQVQKNAHTVCEKIQDAIEQVTGVRSDVKGCSRTDAGVHALGYRLNFRTEASLSEEALVRALNANLPKDIAVLECELVPDGFHARYDVKSKEYIYRIWNAPIRDPFWEGRALHVLRPIDVGLLDGCGKSFCGTHDFSAFCASGSGTEDTVRTVYRCTVARDGDMVQMTISANGFLYHMVRIAVGTLLSVNEGKIAPRRLPEIIVAGDRTQTGPTAPACGLYLNRVIY